MKNEAVALAVKILDLGAGPSYKDYMKEVRAWAKALSKEERAAKIAEVRSEEFQESEEARRQEQEGLLMKLGFSSTDAFLCRDMRLTSPGLRRLIARRAYMMLKLGWSRLPRDVDETKLTKVENKLCGDMSDDDIEDYLLFGDFVETRS